MQRSTTIGFLAPLGAMLLVGCGRPATLEDCERIVARITELELKQTQQAPDQVDAVVEETKNALKARAMQQCVGKPIRESALRCIEQAKSAEEIVEDCFD